MLCVSLWCFIHLVLQEMSSSGLQSLFNDDSDTVDIVQFVNNAFILVKERQNNRRLHSDYCET